MMLLSIKTDILESVNRGIYGVLILLDGIVYRLVSALFELFYTLAGAQLLDNTIYEAIAQKVYLFVGIIALFSVSVTLLKTMANPDEAGKAVIKSFKSLITSVLLVILMPTIFQYAYSLQGAILSDDIIGKIFRIDLTENENRDDGYQSMHKLCDFSDGDKEIGINLGDNQNVDEEISVSKVQCQSNYITMEVMEAFITPNSPDVTNKYNTTWNQAREYMILTGSFNYVSSFVDQMLDGEDGATIDYSFLISTVAGCVLIYVILSFCIDLGVRTAKLAFYQLISPIPILMRMIPGKEGQFDKWSKSTISTFADVFVRLIIINFIVFILSNLFEIIDSAVGFKNVGLLAKAVLALGLFMFGKQAPKLLSEALGFEAGNLKFGIKGKLTETPIVGKGFSKAYNTANKFKGAATGAMGGLHTSFVNGAGNSGFTTGMIEGWKKGGNQYGNQRQSIYKSYGLEGKAGAFGGQAYIERKTNNIKKSASDAATENIRKTVTNYESNNEIFKNTKNEQLGILRQKHAEVYNQLKVKEQEKVKPYNEEEARILAMQEQSRLAFEDAQNRIKELNAQIQSSTYYDGEELIGYTDAQKQQMRAEIEKLSTVKYDKTQYENMIAQNNIRKENDRELDIIREQLETEDKYLASGSVELSKEAHDAARKIISKKDIYYGNLVSALAKKDSESEVKKYRDSIEGQKAIAVQTQAYEEFQKKQKSKDEKKDK